MERDSEVRFLQGLDRVIGKYCPNKVTFDNVSGFMLKLVKRTVFGEDIEINDLDKSSFEKAITDLSVYVSQDITIESLRELMSRVKITTSAHTRDNERRTVQENTVKRVSHNNSSDFDSNVAVFDFDIASMPKSDEFIKREKETVKRVTNNQISESNYFDGVDLSGENGDFKQKSYSNNISKKDDEFDDSMLGDASYFTDEVYLEVPDVSIDLDY